MTCVEKQGSCKGNGTTAYCQCFIGFSGDNCETMSSQLQAIKTFSNITGINSFIVIAIFIGLIVLNDLSNLVSFLLHGSQKNSLKKKLGKIKPTNKLQAINKPQVKQSQKVTHLDYVQAEE